jgi:hypothetical protein
VCQHLHSSSPEAGHAQACCVHDGRQQCLRGRVHKRCIPALLHVINNMHRRRRFSYRRILRRSASLRMSWCPADIIMCCCCTRLRAVAGQPQRGDRPRCDGVSADWCDRCHDPQQRCCKRAAGCSKVGAAAAGPPHRGAVAPGGRPAAAARGVGRRRWQAGAVPGVRRPGAGESQACSVVERSRQYMKYRLSVACSRTALHGQAQLAGVHLWQHCSPTAYFPCTCACAPAVCCCSVLPQQPHWQVAARV